MTQCSTAACECNPAGVADDGSCTQVTGSGMSAGDCNCKQNVQGRTCDMCRPGYFNLNMDNELGCQDCGCASNGSISDTCDPVTGLCPCKPNVFGDQCDQCQAGFYMPDPSSTEGCQPCGCDLGGSLRQQCDDLTGACQCQEGIEGRTCSEVQDDYFLRDLDFLMLEAEDAADMSDQLIIADEQNRYFTGIGFFRAENGSEIDFGSLTLPIDGLYDVVVRYSLQNVMFWNSSILTITPSGNMSGGNTDCGGVPEVTGQSSFEYSSYMMGVGLSLTRRLCLSASGSYQFTLSDFESGQNNDSAFLSVDSLVLIPVGSSVFADMALSRDYTDCATLYHSLATLRPVQPITGSCRQTIFTASALIYDGATRKI